MEIKITSKQILLVLQVISWILFFGLSVEAGGQLFNTIFALFINPRNAAEFWGIDLSDVFNKDRSHFISLTSVMIIISVLKAIMFYLIIKLFADKQLNMKKPFTMALRRFMVNIAWLALGIGLFAHSGSRFRHWLIEQKFQLPEEAALHFDGSDIWLFMAVILMIFGQILKKGIEIQSENDLTI